jgi:hypothetical protein
MSRSSVAEPPASARRKQAWTELVEQVPIRREVLLAAGAGVLGLIFYFTTLRPPGFLVWVNYASGFGASLLAGYFVAMLIPVGDRGRWLIAGVLAISAVVLWGQFDHYQDRWINDHGDKYSDWTHRWSSKVSHRTLWLKDHQQSAMRGPMSGDPEKPHGRWQETTTKPYQRSRDAWFWYGKRITQGEWELHNRR